MDVNIKVEPESDDEAQDNEDELTDSKQEDDKETFTFVSVKQEAVSNSNATCYWNYILLCDMFVEAVIAKSEKCLPVGWRTAVQFLIEAGTPYTYPLVQWVLLGKTAQA